MRKTLIAMAILSLVSCKHKALTIKEKVAQKVVAYVKENNYKGVIDLIADYSPGKRDTEGIKFYVKSAHDFFDKYGVPSQNSWRIAYDTLSPIFRLEQIEIPIYKGFDEDNRLEEAYIQLSYDYTNQVLPDSLLVSYELITKFRPHR